MRPTAPLAVISCLLPVMGMADGWAVEPGTAVPLQGSRLLDLGDQVRELSLDGEWQGGLNRTYDRTLRVPGLATDPNRVTPGTLWYRRVIAIPPGQWTHGTLTLQGARFAPQVYVNGDLVSSAEGGMAPTVHSFRLPVASSPVAGTPMTVEIALRSLDDLDRSDASAVPAADRWRNNVSSCLWDSVVLRLHGAGEIARVIPEGDPATGTATVRWELTSPPSPGSTLVLTVLDQQDVPLVRQVVPAGSLTGSSAVLDLSQVVRPWSPDHPNLYRLRTALSVGGSVVDAREQSFALRRFLVDGLGFRLNGMPCPVRMGTVVWHRWTRDPEAKDIAFDPAWFERNITRRLKDMGANGMRFHLGLPPERFLDLCDRDGLLVQLEWPFFHGISASEPSMRVQYRTWLDTAMRHPSVVIVHPWNETGGEQLQRARNALDPLLAAYPPVVVSHRELTPVHRYWWSLFENVGLYYDSAEQFGQAVMVDEFGGNYLDGNGDPGGYPTTREACLRFLGRHHTRDERLQLQCDSNARIAEYWRRLDVAGFSPFCILGAPQDGSHWFIGSTTVASPTPKPVWAALAAAFAARSLSLELWDRNFAPGEVIRPPLWFFNDTDQAADLRAELCVVDAATGRPGVPPIAVMATLGAHGRHTQPVDIRLPDGEGEWRVEARLLDPPASAPFPVVSSWRIRTFVPRASERVQGAIIGVSAAETELRALFDRLHLTVVDPEDPRAGVLVGGQATWQQVQVPEVRARYEERLHGGASIVLLDAGPQPLSWAVSTASTWAVPSLSNPAMIEETTLFGGVHVAFREMAEPESAIHPAEGDQALWQGLPHGSTSLWNGLRGGLIVPAADMEVTGLSGKALLATWQARGADPGQIAAGTCFAYELAGSYEFSTKADDKSATDRLRHRVWLLVEDAPALASVINPGAPITTTDLGARYRQGRADGQAEHLAPLANAGKNLSRTPVVKLGFGAGAGNLVLSQLLTRGRLLPGVSADGPGAYRLRHDPVAVQVVLNLLDSALDR